MAQSGYTPIKLYLSTTAAAVPLAADLAPGELAINNNDGKLFYEDSSGVVQVIATKAGASGDVVGPASSTANAIPSFNGTTGKLIQNNSGVTIAANVVTAAGFTGALNGTLGATTPATVVATQVDITAQGDLRLQDTTGGEYVALQAPATIATSYTLTLPVDDGTAGQALVTDGSGVLSWSTAASGDVYGPASATDNAIARFDLTTGKIIQNSVVTIADTTGNMAGVGTLSSGAITSSSLTSGRVPYAGTAGLIQDAAALTFDGTILSATRFAGALNGTVGATTPSTGAFTTLSGTGQLTLTNASNYNLYASGAGANYFAGNVGIGTTTMSQILNVAGVNASGFIGQRIQNYTGGSGIAGVEFSSDPTYAKAAIGLLREQLNGGGTLSLYNASSTSAANWATTDARLQIGFTGAVSLAAPAGSESLRATPIASSVNYWDFYGAVTGADPYLFAGGTDTNRGLKYLTKGTGSHQFQTGTSLTNTQFLIAHTASAVNYFQVTGAATAGAPALSAQGTDTNINLTLTPKGTGGVGIGTPSPTTKFEAFATANSLQIISSVRNDQAGSGIAAIGFNVSSSASGDTSANKAGIGLVRQNVQGVGTLNFYNRASTDTSSFTSTDIVGAIGASGVWSLGATVGSESLRVTPIASAVNYVDVQGAISTGQPLVQPAGSDTNISIALSPKGTGNLNFNSAASLGTTLGSRQRIANFYNNTGNGSYLEVATYRYANGTDWTTAVTRLQAVTDVSLQSSIDFNPVGNNAGIAIVAAAGSLQLKTANETLQFNVAHTASAINYLQVTGAATGNAPVLSAQGSDTNISFVLQPKGTGNLVLQSNGSINLQNTSGANQFIVANTASAVNYITAFGNTAGSGGYFQAAGSDTNISMLYSSKGTGSHVFYTAGNSFTRQFEVTHTASAVNYLQVTGAIASGVPYLQSIGSDTNVDFGYWTKGAGVHRFWTSSIGNEQFRIAHTASAVNYLQVTGGATGGGAALSAQGSDAAISLIYQSKSSGAHFFQTGGNNQFLISHAASAVNYVGVQGGATTQPALIYAIGSDTNIDLKLSPQGTGNVLFGTYTAGVVVQAGYITIKDAGGTTRRLLVG